MIHQQPKPHDIARAETCRAALAEGGRIAYRHGRASLFLPGGGERQISRLSMRVLAPALRQDTEGVFRLAGGGVSRG